MLNNNPIINQRRKGTTDDPYVNLTENKIIKNQKVQLTEIPDYLSHVYITGMNEIYSFSPNLNEFIVDYSYGYISFNITNDNQNVEISYVGTGVSFFPADRVYTKRIEGQVTETLQDVIDLGETAIINLDNLNTAVGNAIITNEALQICEDYNPLTNYIPLNKVIYEGSTYQNKVACNDVLPTDINYWILTSAKGEQGIQGLQGLQGVTGEMPSITIGDTQTLLAGSSATVVRRVGSPDEAPILDFGIPRGFDGTGSGTGDMSKAIYDINSDGKVNSADSADNVPWTGVSSKPTTILGYAITDAYTKTEVDNIATTAGNLFAVDEILSEPLPREADILSGHPVEYFAPQANLTTLETEVITHKAENVSYHTYLSADITAVTVTAVTTNFKPKNIIINAAKLNAVPESKGIWAENGSQSALFKYSTGNTSASTGGVIRIGTDVSNRLDGVVAVTDTGFTITWTRTGTLTGYVIFNVLASTH